MTARQSTRRQRRLPEDAPAHRPREHHRSQPDRCSETECEVTCHEVMKTTRGSPRVSNRTARTVLYDNVFICSPCFSAYQTASYQTAYFGFQKNPSLQPVPTHRQPDKRLLGGGYVMRRRKSLGVAPHGRCAVSFFWGRNQSSYPRSD